MFIITDKTKVRRGGGRRCRFYERRRGTPWRLNGDWNLSHTRWKGEVTGGEGRGEGVNPETWTGNSDFRIFPLASGVTLCFRHSLNTAVLLLHQSRSNLMRKAGKWFFFLSFLSPCSFRPSLADMRRREAAIVILLCVAAACVPAGCDFYDDVVLADTPFAYWRLVRPKDSTDVIADSSKRYILPLPRFPSLPSFFTPPHHACRCPLPLPRFRYLPSLFTPPHRACLFLLPPFAKLLHSTTPRFPLSLTSSSLPLHIKMCT